MSGLYSEATPGARDRLYVYALSAILDFSCPAVTGADAPTARPSPTGLCG